MTTFTHHRSRLLSLCSLSLLLILSFAVGRPMAQADAYSFSNPGPITIPHVGDASPYPSSIDVTGVNGTVTKVTVSLFGFGHICAADIDVLLVGPAGQSVILMSDAGGCYTVSGINLTFDAAAASGLLADSPNSSGTYLPTDIVDGPACDHDDFSAPAPAGPYGTALSVFSGLSGADVNGAWSLFVIDDCIGDQGSITGGWALTITDDIGDVTQAAPTAPPPPPPVPRCTDMNFNANSLIMAVAEQDSLDVHCSILVQNGHYQFWFGTQISHGGSIGSQTLLDQQVIHAVDVFSPTGKTQFEGDVVVCLQGAGAMWVLYDTHSNMPRVPEQTIAWTTPAFPGYTCATLYSPATLVMVASDLTPVSDEAGKH